MTGISVSGVGSGLDINGLVSKLVAAEGQPVSNRLNRREADLQATLSAVGTLKGALAEFQSAVTSLTDPAKFTGMKATVGDASLFKASVSDDVQPSSYSVEVVKLAKAQKLATPADHTFAATTDVVGDGTLTLRFGSYSADGSTFTPDPDQSTKTLTIDASNNTLAGVRDAINTAALGVQANLVNDGNGYRLALSATATGENGALEITVDDSDGNPTDTGGLSLLAYSAATKNLEQTVAAQDALVVVDGLSVTHHSNTLSDVVQGVTLDLQTAKPGTSTELTVTSDTGTVTSAVRAFVKAYNEFSGVAHSLTAYNPQTGERGALLGDAGARSITSQLRQIIGTPVSGTSTTLRSLSNIGISFQRDGTLELDSSKLQAALEADPQGVATLFAGPEQTTQEGTASAQGIAERLDEKLSSLLKDGGSLEARNTSLNARIEQVGEQRTDLQRRLETIEVRYRAQFTAMDKLINQLTGTSNFLTQQLNSASNNNQ